MSPTRYDWLEGHIGRELRPVGDLSFKKKKKSRAKVNRRGTVLLLTNDVLLEMYEKDALTGQARIDARNLKEELKKCHKHEKRKKRLS